jgi:hypothetical protein
LAAIQGRDHRGPPPQALPDPAAEGPLVHGVPKYAGS